MRYPRAPRRDRTEDHGIGREVMDDQRSFALVEIGEAAQRRRVRRERTDLARDGEEERLDPGFRESLPQARP
jgi:hypothetical protein